MALFQEEVNVATFRYMVQDVDRAIEFYRDRLGFSLVQQFGPAMAIVSHDDLQLWLAGPQASASKAMPDGSLPVSGGWNRIVLQVEDLAATAQTLQEAGVRFRNEIVTGPGGQQILCEDPSGNPVELFQPGA